MNLRLLAESLTLAEVNELSNHLYDIKKQTIKAIYLNQDVLSDNEKAMVRINQGIEAIKSVRTRLNIPLLEAKIIVDTFRERM